MTEDIARLADFARRLHIYISTLASGFSFFTFGMVVIALILIADCVTYGMGTMVKNIAIAVAIVSSVVISVFAVYAVVLRARGAREAGVKGWWFMVTFGAPFTLMYSLGPRFLPRYVMPTVWFLCLGIAFLLSHPIYERPLIRKGVMVAKPFLISGTLMLASYPLILYMSYIHIPEGRVGLVESFASGMTLLVYYIAGAYSLYKANELFK
ncbi:MAG: hypothetical protein DRO18_02030 [Thermoprotei archaeon]|nr:MAG: hypothetical protein DRO18_02030 [Thermoprotei archaeon]